MIIKHPTFATKKELLGWYVANKDSLIALKRQEIKEGAEVPYAMSYVDNEGMVIKENKPLDTSSIDVLKVKPVINTCYFMDTHLDVHIAGLWDKSLKENKLLMHLQEHRMEFAAIISDAADLKAYTEKISWKELGYDYPGTTEALLFESTIRKVRNKYMFEQYGKGYVRNHSAGMQYVSMVMAINDKDYGAEFEAWEKYFPLIVNKEFAEDMGIFWAIKEAKLREGSAVPLGSNRATPTLDNNLKNEPGDHSFKEPIIITPAVDYDYLRNNLKF